MYNQDYTYKERLSSDEELEQDYRQPLSTDQPESNPHKLLNMRTFGQGGAHGTRDVRFSVESLTANVTRKQRQNPKKKNFDEDSMQNDDGRLLFDPSSHLQKLQTMGDESQA